MQCAFKGPQAFLSDRYRDYQCPYEAVENALCIFHVEKTPLPDGASSLERSHWVELKRRSEAEFAELLDNALKDPSISECDFRGFQLFSLDLPKTVSKAINFRNAAFDFLSLAGVEFLKSIDFSECKFRGLASFACTFGGPVDFSGAEFSQSSIFAETKFLSSARFWMTKLKSPWFKKTSFTSVDFFLAEIEGNAAFDEATFSSVAHFTHTKFNGDVSFSDVAFNSATSFSSSSFSAAVDFRYTRFAQMSNFSDVTFLGRVRFQRSNFKDITFRALDLGKNSDVIFESVSLEKASFIDTNLEQIRFRDVEWHRVSRSGFLDRRRAAIWDEFQPASLEASDFERIAENYRQLVLIYEKKRDFETAEDFHIGEMEMRRRKKGAGVKAHFWRTKREWLNAFAVYRLSSNYGASYSQAGAILLVLILLFSLAFLYSGFRPAKEDALPVAVPIEYNLLSDSEYHRTTFKQWASDYTSAISLSLSIITFQKDRFYEPLEGWSRFWLYVAVIVLTAQGALVLLAIRRRFRR